jgi:CSLREA domain-containing protein
MGPTQRNRNTGLSLSLSKAQALPHPRDQGGVPRRTLGLRILLGVLLGRLFPLAAATITVNTTADVIVNDLNCSLREAIIAANTDQGRFCEELLRSTPSFLLKKSVSGRC